MPTRVGPVAGGVRRDARCVSRVVSNVGCRAAADAAEKYSREPVRWRRIAMTTRSFRYLCSRCSSACTSLLEGFGVGAHTAAQMLIIFGDNPDRIRAEAAFAKLCGACPIPASSGMTTGRHRLYRGGHRQANAALHRTVVVRMRLHQPTVDGRRPAGRLAAGPDARSSAASNASSPVKSTSVLWQTSACADTSRRQPKRLS